MVKTNAHARHDKIRRYYLVRFPRDFKFEASLAFIRSLNGIRPQQLPVARQLGLRLAAPPTLVFELEADAHGIRYRLGVPPNYADFVVGQLRGQLPGVHVEPDKEGLDKSWLYATELTTTNDQAPFRIGDPSTVVATLLAATQPLKEDQAVLIQWVIAPGESQRPSDSDRLHKEKHSDHTFLVVGRLASTADTMDEAKRLVRRIYSALGSINAHSVRFTERRAFRSAVDKRLFNRTSPSVFPSTLNATELATLIAFPAGSPGVPGLPQGRARHLAADPGIPSEGFVVGVGNFPGAERPLAIPPLARTMHLDIVGQTGSGKSTMIENLAAQEMAQGYGVILLDPNGDLFQNTLNLVPKERIERGEVVVFDPTEEYRPLSLNPLEGDNPYLTADRVFAVFDGMYDMRGRMSRSVDVLQNALLVLAMKKLTLVDMPLLLESSERGKDFRYLVTKGLNHAPLRHFWQNFETLKDSQRRQWTDPLLHRLNPFLIRPGIRASLGQVNSSFSINQVVREGKILLVNLSKGMLGEDTSKLFASLIVSAVWQAAQGRVDIAPEKRTPVFCHLDEFYNYTHLGLGLETVLMEARKYGLCLTLAHQNLNLSPAIRSALDQVRSKIIFQMGAGDAPAMARELAPYVETSDLINLQPFEAVVKVVGSPPATMSAAPPPRGLRTARSAREVSRKLYGRPIAEVEREIAERSRGIGEPRQKPTVGWEEAS